MWAVCGQCVASLKNGQEGTILTTLTPAGYLATRAGDARRVFAITLSETLFFQAVARYAAPVVERPVDEESGAQDGSERHVGHNAPRG